jgi:hypothetical protein
VKIAQRSTDPADLAYLDKIIERYWRSRAAGG